MRYAYDGEHCPECKSVYIDRDRPETDHSEVIRQAKCTDCGLNFREIYEPVDAEY